MPQPRVSSGAYKAGWTGWPVSRAARHERAASTTIEVVARAETAGMARAMLTIYPSWLPHLSENRFFAN
jgi:hypothetical protein